MLIDEERTRPAEIVGERGQRLRWAEPAGDELDGAAGGEVTHLYQMPLARQSIPVPDSGEHIPAGQPAEIDCPAGVRVRQHEPCQRHRMIDLTRHGRLCC